MQGSYILLAAVGIFFLIGGAKRVLRSFHLSSLGAVIIIIAVIFGNMFNPIGGKYQVYIGTLILALLSFIYLLRGNARFVLGSFASVAVITVLLYIYRKQIIERFDITDFASSIMIIGGGAISSFILTRTSGQAFAVSVLSIMLSFLVIQIVNKQQIILGDSNMFDLIIYSSFGAVLLNELVSESVSLFNDRAPDITFEAGEIEEGQEERDSK